MEEHDKIRYGDRWRHYFDMAMMAPTECHAIYVQALADDAIIVANKAMVAEAAFVATQGK